MSRSVETSVKNLPYERLENDTTTSTPKQPSLRVFQDITEEVTFEDEEDSDGKIGTFFDAVVGEEIQDNAYDEQKFLTFEPNPDPSTDTSHVPLLFTPDELNKMKVIKLKKLLSERKLRTNVLKTKLINQLKKNFKS